MTRLYVVNVLKSHIQFLTKTYQPAKCIDKEGNVAGEMPSVKYAPSTDRRSGNQIDQELISVRALVFDLAQLTCQKRFDCRNAIIRSSETFLDTS